MDEAASTQPSFYWDPKVPASLRLALPLPLSAAAAAAAVRVAVAAGVHSGAQRLQRRGEHVA